MAPIEISLPDAREHIRRLTLANSKLNHNVALEIRTIGEKGFVLSRKFHSHDENAVEAALTACVSFNANNLNIYITVNPIEIGENLSKACRDADVIAGTFIFLDADDKGVAEALLSEIKVQYDFLVVTGTKPHLRVHVYTELEKPNFDLIEWQKLMEAMIQQHHCDPAAKNPSRIMRLAGFISHPSEAKRLRGYEPELVRFYERGEDYDFLR